MNPFLNTHRLIISLFAAVCLLLSGFSAAQEVAKEKADTKDSFEEQEASGKLEELDSEPFDNEAYMAALANRNRYEQVIRELENQTTGNAYSAELTEAYLNLGGSLETLEEYDAAAEAFDMALQTVRISSGLSSPQQLEILRKLKTSNELRQDWESVDANLHLNYHINVRNFPPGDERRLQAIDELGSWMLRAASEDLIDGFRNFASDADTLYSSEIRMLEEMDFYEGRNLQIAELNLGAARAKLHMAKLSFEKPLRDFQTGERQTITQQRCYTVRLPDGSITQVCETIEVPNVNYYVEPSSRKMLEVTMNLQDSRKSILEAWEILQTEAADTEKRDSLLEKVQELTGEYNQFMTENSL